MEKNTIKYMLGYVTDYEKVKNKEHPEFKTARSLFAAKGICFQNFYKFYKRYIISGRDEQALLPTRRGPKPKYKELPLADDSIEQKVLEYRKHGFNKFLISAVLKQKHGLKKHCSATSVYRILKKYGESKLTKAMTTEKRKIIRDFAGSLGHVDCHVLPKGIVKSEPTKRYYVLGCIDDYSRICWVEVTESVKALDACFAMMDIVMIMNQRYGISFEEVMTDNGSEFCGGSKSLQEHPFERMLIHFGIKHRKTQPYRPQTNGKIERFWRTFDDEVIEGAEYNNLDELKDSILGYNFYYNENRPHQGLNGKTPQSMIEEGATV
jgi:transposase InsO family protein